MKLSVVVCTRDRAASLARTLDSIARAEPPRRAALQVVVADNASSDDTQPVIARFRDRLPLRAVFEPRAGSSHARNAGVAAADGDYLLWADDDVTVGRGWLRSYEDAIEAHPDAAFFGGPIHPRFEGTPPRWVRQGWPFVSTVFGALDLSPQAIVLDAHSRQLPFGSSMAIRGDEQRKYAYDPALGRRPGPLVVSGEETDVLRRIAADGGTGVWVPEAWVEHWIAPERQTIEYVRRYHFGIGYVGAKQSLATGQRFSLSWQLRTRWRLAWHHAVYLTGRLCGRVPWWARSLRRCARMQGRLRAHREALALPPGGGGIA